MQELVEEEGERIFAYLLLKSKQAASRQPRHNLIQTYPKARKTEDLLEKRGGSIWLIWSQQPTAVCPSVCLSVRPPALVAAYTLCWLSCWLISKRETKNENNNKRTYTQKPSEEREKDGYYIYIYSSPCSTYNIAPYSKGRSPREQQPKKEKEREREVEWKHGRDS